MSSSLCCNLDVTTCKYSFSIFLMLCLICPCPVPYIRYAVPHIPYMSQGAMNLHFAKQNIGSNQNTTPALVKILVTILWISVVTTQLNRLFF